VIAADVWEQVVAYVENAWKAELLPTISSSPPFSANGRPDSVPPCSPKGSGSRVCAGVPNPARDAPSRIRASMRVRMGAAGIEHPSPGEAGSIEMAH
jgi:hypothetical protein